MAIKKLCNHVGCSHFATAHGYCEQHQSDYTPRENKWSESPYKNLYNTSRWRELSNKILLERPLCQLCMCKQSQEVHHIVHGEGDEFFNEDYLVALCHDCHLEETRRETQERREAKKAEEELKKRYGI